jgi:hypothetical protein
VKLKTTKKRRPTKGHLITIAKMASSQKAPPGKSGTETVTLHFRLCKASFTPPRCATSEISTGS